MKSLSVEIHRTQLGRVEQPDHFKTGPALSRVLDRKHLVVPSNLNYSKSLYVGPTYFLM